MENRDLQALRKLAVAEHATSALAISTLKELRSRGLIDDAAVQSVFDRAADLITRVSHIDFSSEAGAYLRTLREIMDE